MLMKIQWKKGFNLQVVTTENDESDEEAEAEADMLSQNKINT